jgi:hypothetical protein
LARVGLLVLALGVLGDGAFHALPAALAPLVPLVPLAGPAGMHAHVVIFGGMLLVLGGVVRQGVHR